MQHQSCLFQSSPLCVFPASDCFFIIKDESPHKFKSFFSHTHVTEIKHHDFNLIGTHYRFSLDSSPVIFFHPVSSEVTNRLLSCDLEKNAKIKYHPRLESFQANNDLFDSYRPRIIPKNQDATELSYAITYYSAVIVELINCSMPFICLSPPRDFESMPFFNKGYRGFCASFVGALILLTDTRKPFDSFSSSYLST